MDNATFELRRLARLARVYQATYLLVKLPPLLAITDVGGYEFTGLSLFGEDPFDEADYDDEDDCQGHESLRGDYMGKTFYCDGTCTGHA